MNLSLDYDNKRQIDLEFNGFAVAGSSVTFIFEHHPTAATPPQILKTVTTTSIRQSLFGAFYAKQLSDMSFYSRLDKLLSKAESDAASGKNKQAADRLEQFVRRLDAAFKKTADANDGDDPDDIKSAGSMKRFITKTALDSLSADARTLIAGLGKKSKK